VGVGVKGAAFGAKASIFRLGDEGFGCTGLKVLVDPIAVGGVWI
jgi:hypothetical protein